MAGVAAVARRETLRLESNVARIPAFAPEPGLPVQLALDWPDVPYEREPFRIVFVTVDPERDGPAEVGKYGELFNSPVIGLTGSPAQIAQVKKQFGIFSQKVPDEGGGYSVDHTASVLLFDRAGKFVATISPEEGDAAALAKLKRIAA